MRRGGLVRWGDARRGWWVVPAMVLLLTAGHALADTNPVRSISRLVSSLDGLARNAVVDLFGGPKTVAARNNAAPPNASYTEKRSSESLHPTGQSPVISVSAVFTNVTVSTWDERLIRVQAEFTGEAASAEQAKQLAESGSVAVQAAENLAEIQVNVPSVTNIPGGAVGVNLELTIPRQASLILENQFGDVHLRSVNGLIGLDVSYGAVTLEQIGGNVRAKILGEMAFKVTDLAQGGTFELKGARAELTRVSGTLKLSNFGGSVRISEPGDTLNADLTIDGGEIELALDPKNPGDIGISGVCSSLESMIQLDLSEQGDRLVARRAQPDAGRRWSVNLSFSRMRISTSLNTDAAVGSNLLSSLSPPVTDTISQALPVPPMPTVILDLAPGDLVVEPGADGEVSLSVTRSAQPAAAADAARLLNEIQLEATTIEHGVRVRTYGPSGTENGLDGFWRADVVLRVPRDATLDINATEGNLVITAIEKTARIRFRRGDARLTRCSGPVEIDGIACNLRIAECSGPVKITNEDGDIRLERITGPITVDAGSGKVLIDAPRNSVRVTAENAELRMLSLDPLGGDVIVRGGKGNVVLVIAPESSANITLRAEGGRVDSRIPLTGFIDRDRQEFTGKLGDGTFTLMVETRGGNITLN